MTPSSSSLSAAVARHAPSRSALPMQSPPMPDMRHAGPSASLVQPPRHRDRMARFPDPQVALADAIRRRDVRDLVLACQHGASAHLPLPGNTPPLHLAARLGFVAGVRALLATGARPEACDRRGMTALSEAAAAGEPAVISLLADQLRRSGAARDANPGEPRATRFRHSICERLCGRRPRAPAPTGGEGEALPIDRLALAAQTARCGVEAYDRLEACMDDDLDALRVLAQAATPFDKRLVWQRRIERLRRDMPHGTAADWLEAASVRNDLGGIFALLAACRDTQDRGPSLPSHSMMRLRLDIADLDRVIAAAITRMRLTLAVTPRHAAALTCMIEARASMASRTWHGRQGLRHWLDEQLLGLASACRHDTDLMPVRTLIALGANVNASRQQDGASVLHLAVGSAALTSLLVARGSRLAARRETLLREGAARPANHGDTPLHAAARRLPASMPALAVLLQAGADASLRNHRGETPLDLATRPASRLRRTAVRGLRHLFQVAARTGAGSRSG
ncbi:ankyrin repeat domain-containing protein [Noviherbaspirillum galbum]|uniref:Ankyrin repeat domain-containing protein n=1 Tax=Noviherbaspirillum galbum TaxID=2709383 RepID=A0A6B3SU26_9BURK|nr:ankyrin repeat domain-containing protein [Noviherbaspirillum galbum]NEX64500.1 ankyrin repeat domain-containing protein [Noviherbaspirillum galbum]